MKLSIWMMMALLSPVTAQDILSGTMGHERRQERRQKAREEYPELQQRLQNPLARILSVPVRVEYFDGAGVEGDGQSMTIRVAPRIPITLSESWHLISKTDIAWKRQKNVFDESEQEGITDLAQTFFFSPERSLGWGVYWGVGPTFIIPTATNDLLGSDKLSLGPSLAVFKQTERWIAGLICSHVWSVSGSGKSDVNGTRIEPLITYTAPTATSIGLGAEINYNWESDAWLIPLELSVSQLTILWGEPVQWTLGGQYFAKDDGHAPEWGAFFQVTIPLDLQGAGGGAME
jgi:hypothetical protein